MSRALRRQQLREKARARPAAGVRPVVSRPAAAKTAARKESRGFLSALKPRILTDVFSELRKVVWPTRQDTMYLAVVVVIVTIILGAVLGAIDIAFGWLVDRTLLN
jgi:preprotein translocase SecE subunit